MLKNFFFIVALFASLIIMSCSDEFVPPTGPDKVNPTPTDTISWSATTDLKVNSGQLRQTEKVVIGHAGEFHLWLLMKYDTQSKYMLWVVFNYQDGSKKLFPVPDLYSDRPSTILFDVGMAAVEDTLSVTLLIEKLSTSGAALASANSLCDGWDRLLEIHGSNVVPITSVALDKVVHLDPESGN
ncbi:MAG: hypothetical protein ABIH38_03850 [Patescibacteria group bacterium]